MVKLKFGTVEIQAQNARDLIVILDKYVQYNKIMDFKSIDSLLSCVGCGSFDLEPIAPSVVRCRCCGLEMEEEIIFEPEDDE